MKCLAMLGLIVTIVGCTSSGGGTVSQQGESMLAAPPRDNDCTPVPPPFRGAAEALVVFTVRASGDVVSVYVLPDIDLKGKFLPYQGMQDEEADLDADYASLIQVRFNRDHSYFEMKLPRGSFMRIPHRGTINAGSTEEPQVIVLSDEQYYDLVAVMFKEAVVPFWLVAP